MKNLFITALIVTLTALINISPAHAYTPGCTDWVKTTGSKCNFAGNWATPWTRECTNEETACRTPRIPGNRGVPCDALTICLENNINPNYLESTCTDWVQVRGARCIDGSQKWVRACQMEYVEDGACSDSYPYSTRTAHFYFTRW